MCFMICLQDGQADSGSSVHISTSPSQYGQVKICGTGMFFVLQGLFPWDPLLLDIRLPPAFMCKAFHAFNAPPLEFLEVFLWVHF
jgi:hypothetical protein